MYSQTSLGYLYQKVSKLNKYTEFGSRLIKQTHTNQWGMITQTYP